MITISPPPSTGNDFQNKEAIIHYLNFKVKSRPANKHDWKRAIISQEIKDKVSELNRLINIAGKHDLTITLTGNGTGILKSHFCQISLRVKIEQTIQY